jgi:WxcM-like, C-terminal
MSFASAAVGELRTVAVSDECRLISFPRITDARGTLTALEELIHVPFRIGSVRWFYDVPAGVSSREGRAGPGDTLVVALSGSFDVVVNERRVHLSRAYWGLYVPDRVEWRPVDPSTSSVGLVVSSHLPTGRHRPLSDQPDRDVPGALDVDSTINDCCTLALPRRIHAHGSSTEVIGSADLPFEILRVYYVYDVPGGAWRGGHAHQRQEEVLVAAAGSFEVMLDDGHRAKTIRLDRAHSGVHITSRIWRELRDFSSGAICLVLASAGYDEADYVRDYDEFRRAKRVRENAAPPPPARTHT